MKSTNTLLVLIVMAALSLSLSAFANEGVLRGKVHKDDAPTRIQRPAMPVLDAAASDGTRPTGTTKKSGGPHIGSLIEDDFLLNFKGKSQAPKTAPLNKTDKELDGEAEDQELIVEWEEWHHRVSDAIFQRWRKLGVYPGVARTTLTFNRDGRIEVNVRSLELPPNLYEVMMPEYRHYGVEEIRNLFAQAVQNSVMPLNGSSTVRFPARSKRTVMRLTPYFAGDVDEGYTWKHGDYERVPLE